MLSLFVINGQSENVSRTMGSGDSLQINVKFEKVKLSKEESTAQELVNTLLLNSVRTTENLSTNINRLTTAVEQGITLSQQTKLDIVITQLGLTQAGVEKLFKRNNTFKLVALIPSLLFIFYAMTQFLTQKGLDIKHLLAGTAVMALYSLIGSAVLYAVLSLIFNKQFFVVKDLMSAIF